MNSSAIDRGLYSSMSVKKVITSIQKNQATSQDDLFIKPDPTQVSGMKYGSYEKLNERGYIPEEIAVNNGDIVIGKVSPIQPTGNSNKIFKDSSEYYKSHVPGVIDRVWTDIYDNEGYEMRKMRIRSERIPTVGDKYCLTADAEVLTSQGWINITKITKNDKVATLVDDKYIKYENPTNIYNPEYDGQMYKVRSQQVDLDVTIDHDLYVKTRNSSKFERISAKEVYGKRYRFKKWAENNNPDIETMTIPAYEKYPIRNVKMDDFLDLLGVFISDGCINNNRILIAGEKQRKIKHIQDIAKNLNLQVYYSKDETTKLNSLGLGSNHVIIDTQLANFLRPLILKFLVCFQRFH